MNVDGKKDEIKDIEIVVRNMLTLINKQGTLNIDDIHDLLSSQHID